MSDQPAIDPVQIANHRLSLADRDASLGKQKAAEMSAQ